MTTQQLINGIKDIERERIPVECIIDMAPEIVRCLGILSRLEAILHDKQDRNEYTIMRAILTELRRHELTPVIELNIQCKQRDLTDI